MVVMNTYTRLIVAAMASAPLLLAACSRESDEAAARKQADALLSPAPAPGSSAPGSSAPGSGAAEGARGANDDGAVRAASVAFEKPESWRIVPAGSMRAAQLAAPASDGAEDAEVVFFHFGPRGAGSVDDNIARWANLVLDDDGMPDDPNVNEHSVSGLRITEVQLEGTYMSGSPAGPKTPRHNFVMLGAIVQGGPEGDVFIRMTGPAAVVRAHEQAWRSLLLSARTE